MPFWRRNIRIYIFCVTVIFFTETLLFIYQICVDKNYVIKTDERYLFSRNDDKLTPVNESVGHVKYFISEVDDFIQLFQSRYRGEVSVLGLAADEPYDTFLKRLNSLKKKGVKLYTHLKGNATSSTERFQRGISQFHMYDPSDEQLIQDLLHDLSTLPIVHSELLNRGSQMKIILTFSDGAIGYFKPKRVPKDIDSSPDVFFFNAFERYNAEIAAFHIDRVLGFHRAGPVVGRQLNITADLAFLISDAKVVDFVYTSPGGNLCFVAKCLQKCGLYNPFCGDGVFLEGSVAASLLSVDEKTFHSHPYARTYTSSNEAAWENDDKFCEKYVKKNMSFFEILEFVDLAVLDFFTGNLDRHLYYIFTNMKEPRFSLATDSGRGFNKAGIDTLSTLATLQQCCLIRLSTLAKLIKLYQGPDRFSHIMRVSLNSDPLSPILTEAHLEALDRRVGKVIKVVSGCINNGRSWEDVVIDDIKHQPN